MDLEARVASSPTHQNPQRVPSDACQRGAPNTVSTATGYSLKRDRTPSLQETILHSKQLLSSVELV